MGMERYEKEKHPYIVTAYSTSLYTGTFQSPTLSHILINHHVLCKEQ